MATKSKFSGLLPVKLETYWVPVGWLKTSKFQPAGRDKPAKSKLLRQSVEINGFWDTELIQIDQHFNVIDGHRRLAVAIALGYEKVPCVVVRDNPKKRFSWKNDTQKPISSQEMMDSILRGNTVVTPKHKPHVDLVKTVLGDNALQYLASRRASHRVIFYARELARYLGRDDSNVAVLAQTTRWLADHKMQFHVRDHMYVRHTPPEVIAYYVDNNLPMLAGHPVLIAGEQEQSQPLDTHKEIA